MLSSRISILLMLFSLSFSGLAEEHSSISLYRLSPDMLRDHALVIGSYRYRDVSAPTKMILLPVSGASNDYWSITGEDDFEANDNESDAAHRLFAAVLPPGRYRYLATSNVSGGFRPGRRLAVPQAGVPVEAGKIYYLGEMTCVTYVVSCTWVLFDRSSRDISLARQMNKEIDWSDVMQIDRRANASYLQAHLPEGSLTPVDAPINAKAFGLTLPKSLPGYYREGIVQFASDNYLFRYREDGAKDGATFDVSLYRATPCPAERPDCSMVRHAMTGLQEAYATAQIDTYLNYEDSPASSIRLLNAQGAEKPSEGELSFRSEVGSFYGFQRQFWLPDLSTYFERNPSDVRLMMRRLVVFYSDGWYLKVDMLRQAKGGGADMAFDNFLQRLLGTSLEQEPRKIVTRTDMSGKGWTGR